MSYRTANYVNNYRMQWRDFDLDRYCRYVVTDVRLSQRMVSFRSAKQIQSVVSKTDTSWQRIAANVSPFLYDAEVVFRIED